jgi:PPM family protein phosphatase
MIRLDCAADSQAGPRDENEDAWWLHATPAGGQVLLVCDGMGGMGRGAEASRMAIDVLGPLLAGGGPHSILRAALVEADQHLRRALVDPGPGKPGCTAVVAHVDDGRAFVAWAGDARAYHVRGGRVLARTTDHKLVEELVAVGAMNPGRTADSPIAHVVTRCLGGKPSTDPPVDPQTLERPWHLEPGDALVLCSDGISDVLSDPDLALAVAGGSPEDIVRTLIQEALHRGTEDNVTVVAAVYGAVMAALPRPDTPTVPAGRGAPGQHPDLPGPPEDPLLDTVETKAPAVEPTDDRNAPDLPEAPEPAPPQRAFLGVVVASLLLVIAAVVVAVWWLNGTPESPPPPDPPEAPR